MFVDRAEITIKSGKGGDGAVSFRREAHVPDGGPDGGNGGNGGNIVFIGDPSIKTLMDFRYRKKYQAENGENGKKKNQYGKKGEDLYIKVPLGTIIIDQDSGIPIKDMKEKGEEYVAAKGGRGGKGNTMFKTSTRQAPNFAQAGSEAVERRLALELKLIADVGLVGFPNVGKSTLLSVVTGANPKIADYHFTTLFPNLGVVEKPDSAFVMADIPGLIEGAHQGVGLGLDFLKHVERTRLLLHLVDVSGIEGRDPLEDFVTINKELASYSEKLAGKPQIIVANKVDIADEDQVKDFTQAMEAKGYKVFATSAPMQKGIKELVDYTFSQLATLPMEEVEVFPYFDDRGELSDEEFKAINVEMDEDVFVLSGHQLDRIFRSTNLNDYGSLRYLYKYIEKTGIIEEMQEMGLEEGDTVRINDFEFDYKSTL